MSVHFLFSLQGFHISRGQIICTGTVSSSFWRDSLDLPSRPPQFHSGHLRPWLQHVLSQWTCRQQSVQDIQLKGKDLKLSDYGVIRLLVVFSIWGFLVHVLMACDTRCALKRMRGERILYQPVKVKSGFLLWLTFRFWRTESKIPLTLTLFKKIICNVESGKWPTMCFRSHYLLNYSLIPSIWYNGVH